MKDKTPAGKSFKQDFLAFGFGKIRISHASYYDALRKPPKNPVSAKGMVVKMPSQYRRSDDRMQSGTGANITRKKRPTQVDPHRRRPKPVKRKVRRGVIWFFLLVLLLATGITLSLTVLFRVKTITVKGETRYDHAELIAQSGLATDVNLFLADTGRVKERLTAAYPYIETVRVRRLLPDRLTVEITETTTLAAIVAGEEFTLINAQGRLLETVSSPPDGLMRLTVKTVLPLGRNSILEPQELGVFTELREQIAAEGIGNIVAIHMLSSADIVLNYQNRIAVKLGPAVDLDIKLRYAKTVLDTVDKRDGEAKGTLDCSTYSTQRSEGYFHSGIPDFDPAPAPDLPTETPPFVSSKK